MKLINELHNVEDVDYYWLLTDCWHIVRTYIHAVLSLVLLGNMYWFLFFMNFPMLYWEYYEVYHEVDADYFPPRTTKYKYSLAYFLGSFPLYIYWLLVL